MQKYPRSDFNNIVSHQYLKEYEKKRKACNTSSIRSLFCVQ